MMVVPGGKGHNLLELKALGMELGRNYWNYRDYPINCDPYLEASVTSSLSFTGNFELSLHIVLR